MMLLSALGSGFGDVISGIGCRSLVVLSMNFAIALLQVKGSGQE